MRNKTDRNDARGIAQLVRLGWFRQVHVKSEDAQRIRMLLVNRQQLLTKALDLENSVRGSLKVFGLRVGTVTRRTFEARVLELVAEDRSLMAITEPMLRVRRTMIRNRLLRRLSPPSRMSGDRRGRGGPHPIGRWRRSRLPAATLSLSGTEPACGMPRHGPRSRAMKDNLPFFFLNANRA
jgi:Transposase